METTLSLLNFLTLQIKSQGQMKVHLCKVISMKMQRIRLLTKTRLVKTSFKIGFWGHFGDCLKWSSDWWTVC